MKSAIVTGATSGIGFEIVNKLLKLNFKVYGIGRNFLKNKINNLNYIEVKLDLSNVKNIEQKIKDIDKKDLYILVNSAGFGEFKPHEEINIETIDKMIDINLKAPILLSKLLLRDLKKNRGYIFNITSIEAIRHSKFSALYSATKSGLRNFGLSLFEEVRKSGIKIVTINPDITKTDFFDKLHFKESEDNLAYIEPKCISETIEYILNLRDGTIIEEITIRPQVLKIMKKKEKYAICRSKK